MSKYNKIIEICFWISSILNSINLIIVYPYHYLGYIILPSIFFIYSLITSILTVKFFLELFRNEVLK